MISYTGKQRAETIEVYFEAQAVNHFNTIYLSLLF